MDDKDVIAALVSALRPFALAAERNAHLSINSPLYHALRAMDGRPYHYTVYTGDGEELNVNHLHAAADALRAAGYADALTDSNARAALEGDE